MSGWTDAPIVEVPLWQPCPACGSPAEPIYLRYFRSADGSSTRRCVCRACSARFVLIAAPPDDDGWLPNFGKSENDD